MKRSEAIQIIANRIYELNVEPEDCDEEADRILQALELAGMHPPRYLREVDDALIPGDIPMGDGKFGTPVEGWEDE